MIIAITILISHNQHKIIWGLLALFQHTDFSSVGMKDRPFFPSFLPQISSCSCSPTLEREKKRFELNFNTIIDYRVYRSSTIQPDGYLNITHFQK